MPVPRLSANLEVAAQELAALLRGLLSHERDVITEFLLYLAEFDRRGFALALGYRSPFDYCTRGLGLSSSAAYRRITAARLLRRFPVVEPLLRDGRLSPTTLSLLKDVLSEANHADLLARAEGLTKEQVEALVAVLRPKAAPRDSVRQLPPPRVVALPATAVPDATNASEAAPAAGSETGRPPEVLVTVQQVPPTRVEPITENLRVLKVTVSREFLAELDEVRAALSHVVPSGRFEDVMRECFRRVLTPHRSRSSPRAATPPPQHPATSGARAVTAPMDSARPTEPERAPIPVELERQVRQRDGNRCAFVGPDGRVCGSTHQLEIHHRRPVGRGGGPELENLMLVCRRHNDWLARLDYGEEHMARCRQQRRMWGAGTAAGGGEAGTAAGEGEARAAAGEGGAITPAGSGAGGRPRVAPRRSGERGG